MRKLLKSVALALALGAATALTSGAAVASAVQPAAVTIPFSPPLGQDIGYRYESTRTEDGESGGGGGSMTLRFARDGSGFAVTVTPSNLDLPDEAEAVMGDILDLAKKPYTLTLSNDGEITGMKDGDAYWTQMIDAAQALFKQMMEGDGDKAHEGGMKAATDMIESFRTMPADARLAFLTKDIAPIFEMAATQWTANEAVVGEVDAPTPFGMVKRQVKSTLIANEGGVARIESSATVPREELERLTLAMIAQVADSMGPEKAAEAKKALSGGIFETFVHETESDYKVATATGLLSSLTTAETIKVKAGGQSRNRVTKTVITLEK